MADAKNAEKAQKKEAAKARRAARTAQYKQLWQAFNQLRKTDKALVPMMLAAIILIPVVLFLFGMLFNGQYFMLPLGIAAGLIAAMFIFTRRMENSVYAQADGEPGAAGWAVENLRSGVGMTWRAKAAVATTPQMDAVHRVVGLCGVVLVGEGDPQRVRRLFGEQRKRLSKVIGATPVYEIIVGHDEGQIPLRKLQRELMRLPRNISKDEVYALSTRIESLDHAAVKASGLPKGPIPKGARVSGMNRRARRMQSRGQA